VDCDPLQVHNGDCDACILNGGQYCFDVNVCISSDVALALPFLCQWSSSCDAPTPAVFPFDKCDITADSCQWQQDGSCDAGTYCKWHFLLSFCFGKCESNELVLSSSHQVIQSVIAMTVIPCSNSVEWVAVHVSMLVGGSVGFWVSAFLLRLPVQCLTLAWMPGLTTAITQLHQCATSSMMLVQPVWIINVIQAPAVSALLIAALITK